MKELFEKTWAFLGKTWVWTLLLVLACALLIWWLGPLLAVDDYRFWSSASARLLSISVLCLLWGLFMVFVSWRATLERHKAMADEQGQLERSNQASLSEAQSTLRARFKDALNVLKTSSLYRGRSERWRSDLPWYLLIGPQQSGKTSLLDFSGLEFPLNTLASKLSRDSQGTEHCDWYFTDNGVVIDTSGRYVDQANPQVDAPAWSTLLSLLRSRRRTRPLNGVLLAIPVSLLQASSAEQMAEFGRLIRNRLGEIHDHLRVELPVYLVLSKADQIAGFEAFFDALSREESEQVLGASFAKEQRGGDVDVLNAEFEQLLARLNTQVIARIHQERDKHRRGQILDFPLQLGRLGSHLGVLVDAAFSGNRFQRSSTLRGFYFTSAPHVEPGAVAEVDGPPLPLAHRGRARFIHNLLSRVIFPEAALAGLDKRETRRINWRQRAMYVAALAGMGLFGWGWASSFSNNDKSLETLKGLAEQHARQHVGLHPGDDAMAVLPLLDNRYAATQVFPAAGDVPFSARGGLYQGGQSRPTLMQAYERALNEELLPRVAHTLEAQIRANMGNRERLLDSLRTYLMLNMADRRDADTLKEWMTSDWSRRYLGNTAVQTSLDEHFTRLLQQAFIYPLDETLVSRARQMLRREPLSAVVYRVLREQARDLPDYRLSQHLGARGALFEGADYVIPGFYTRQGYQQYFMTQGLGLVREILRDNWVLGEGSTLTAMDLRRLMVDLEQQYFTDYADHWSEAINRVGLQPLTGAREGAEQALGLTAAHSPLLQMLLQVRENTRFAALPDPSDSVEQATDALGKPGKVAVSLASETLMKKLPDTAKKSLQRRFEPLHRLLDENDGPAADLAPLFQALNDLHLQLSGLARSSQPEQAAYELAKLRMSGQRDALSALRMTASRLPRPISTWFNGLVDDTWMLQLHDSYQYLNQQYQAQVYGFYSKAIKQRYPFYAHSSSDVALNDFREFFKPQGMAERFFDTYLSAFVSGEAGQYRLRSIDGRSLPMSRVFLEQMRHAQTIRRSFFAENPNEPQVLFKLEPYTLDPAVSRAQLRFGDQQMVYRHGPIVPMSFTWPTDADDGRTSLVLEAQDGKALGIEKNTGAWSLFRLFDLMQTEYQSGRDVLMIKANVGGMRANYLVLSQRTPNPFDLASVRSFRLPASL